MESHVAQDRNSGPGYGILILWLIPGDLYSACPRGQFHRQSGCTVNLKLRAKQEGSLCHFYDGLWYDPPRDANIQPTAWKIYPRLRGAKIIWIVIWITIWIPSWIAIQNMYLFTGEIHCSIQQSAPQCCSLFSNCYIAIHLIFGLKLSRSRSR